MTLTQAVLLAFVVLFAAMAAVALWLAWKSKPRVETIPHVDVLRLGDRVYIQAQLSGGGSMYVSDLVTEVGPNWFRVRPDEARSHRFNTVYQAQLAHGAVTVERLK